MTEEVKMTSDDLSKEKPFEIPDELGPFVDALEQRLDGPWKTPNEIMQEMDAQQKEQVRIRQEFASTEIGKRLVQIRDFEFGPKILKQFYEELQQGTPRATTIMGLIVDEYGVDDKNYQALMLVYEKRFKEFLRSKKGVT